MNLCTAVSLSLFCRLEWKRSIPPILIKDKTEIARIIVRKPPIHWRRDLQNKIPFGDFDTSIIIEEPLDVMPDIDSKKASVKCTKISENRKGKDEKSPSKGQTKIVKIIITLVLKLYSLPREASSNATPENNPREDEKINEKATDISLYENEIKAGKNIAKEINNIDQPKENNKVEIICIKISLKKIKSYSKKFF